MERTQGSGFGETLRRAREAAKLTEEQLAEVTRVQARYVRALEAEDWDAVPPGVIGRGFVRLLAKRLGTAGEALPALYAEARREEPPVLHTPPGQTFPVTLRSSDRGRPVLMALGFLLCVAAGIWVWSPWTRELPPAPTPVPEAALAPAQPESIPAAESAEPAQPELPPPAAVPALQRLDIVAVDAVWVSVGVDGGRPVGRLLQPGQREVYEARESFVVRLGNAGGVQLVWNGEPLRAAGAPGQVVDLSLPEALGRLRP
jgi:cytoskeleton protein RodZ